jgi:hypothetical protein
LSPSRSGSLRAPSPPSGLRRGLLAAALGVTVWAPPRAIAQTRPGEQFPDIVAVQVRRSGAASFDFDVTVSSPYETPARYADGFRVMSPTGEVFGERKLLHDHQGEQPFTRDLYGVRIPAAVERVVVQGRDQRSGYGGKTVQVHLPSR